VPYMARALDATSRQDWKAIASPEPSVELLWGSAAALVTLFHGLEVSARGDKNAFCLT
jgi:hypothetical protein